MQEITIVTSSRNIQTSTCPMIGVLDVAQEANWGALEGATGSSAELKLTAALKWPPGDKLESPEGDGLCTVTFVGLC